MNDYTVKGYSSDTSVLTVNENCIVTAVSPGTAVILYEITSSNGTETRIVKYTVQ